MYNLNMSCISTLPAMVMGKTEDSYGGVKLPFKDICDIKHWSVENCQWNKVNGQVWDKNWMLYSGKPHRGLL